MALILAILLILLPSLVRADDMAIEKYSVCTEIDRCSEEMPEYFWQDRGQEVSMQIAELSEKLHHAIVFGEYISLNGYLKFPISFYIEDNKNNKTGLRRDAIQKTLVSHNISEFENNIKKLRTQSKETVLDIQQNGMRALASYNNADVSLFALNIRIEIGMKCEGLILEDRDEVIVLPEDIEKCLHIRPLIKSIFLTLN